MDYFPCLQVDVIVCSTASGLDLNAGQSSKALLEAGGKTLQDDCENNYGGGIDCGEIAVVGPGKLSCKKVYFGCLPKHSTDPKVAEKVCNGHYTNTVRLWIVWQMAAQYVDCLTSDY